MRRVYFNGILSSKALGIDDISFVFFPLRITKLGPQWIEYSEFQITPGKSNTMSPVPKERQILFIPMLNTTKYKIDMRHDPGNPGNH